MMMNDPCTVFEYKSAERNCNLGHVGYIQKRQLFVFDLTSTLPCIRCRCFALYTFDVCFNKM